MVDRRTMSDRRDGMLNRLGAQPARYAVACVMLSVLWFPIRLAFDHGDPIALIVAASGLYGTIWALIPLAIEWVHRVRLRFRGSGRDLVETAPMEPRAWARRGAIVSLGVSVPFFGALIALCLITDRSPVYPVWFGLVLLVIVAAAVRSLRRGSGRVTG